MPMPRPQQPRVCGSPPLLLQASLGQISPPHGQNLGKMPHCPEPLSPHVFTVSIQLAIMAAIITITKEQAV